MDFFYALGGAVLMAVGILIGYSLGDRSSNKKQKESGIESERQ